MIKTDMYESLLAETIMVPGNQGELVHAYFARPLGAGPFAGVVLAHHMPGWDEWYREATLRFTRRGYLAISPNLYERTGHGTPEDVAAKARAAGGIPDDQAVGDLAGTARFLRALLYSSGKIAVFGTCSGGRHAYLAACRTDDFNAVIDCWGGRVVMRDEDLNPKQPVSPHTFTKDLNVPMLGLFGAEDQSPSPQQVGVHEQELKKHGKDFEFHMYPGAGHGFFYYNRPAYRVEQAVDGWNKIWAFLEKTLQ